MRGLLEEGIGDGREVLVERDDAALAGFVGEGDDLMEDLFAVGFAGEEDAGDLPESGEKDVEGKLQQDRADGSSDNDESSGRLSNLRDVAAFHHHA